MKSEVDKIAQEEAKGGISIEVVSGLRLSTEHYNDEPETFVRVRLTDKINGNKRGFVVSVKELPNVRDHIRTHIRELKNSRR